MKTQTATDAQWDRWVEVQKQTTQTWFKGKASEAITIVSRYLDTVGPSDLRREAFGFRASIHQDQGDLLAAKADFLAALELAPTRDYVRCELEDSLGSVCQQLGEVEEADGWFLAALESAAGDPRVAGGGLLKRLLRVRGERGLTPRERNLAVRVVRQGWVLLHLEGEPELVNLVGAADALLKAQGHPFSADHPPSPVTSS